MDISFLPARYISALSYNVDMDKLSELRMRVGFGVSCIYKFKKSFLSNSGVTLFSDMAIVCTDDDIKEILNNVTEYSVYAFNDMIKQGFLTTKTGIRIGLAGECVCENGQIITIKNINSLNIRIAKNVKNCSSEIIKYVYNKGSVNNSLIISPPAFGKTTILKDLAQRLNSLTKLSILIIDERGEFETIKGVNIDKISYSDKLYALTRGVRTMSPDVVITDEISSINDWKCVLNAVNSGVKIIASCHGATPIDLQCKDFYSNGLFDRYIFLDEKAGKAGVLKEVYNRDWEKV